MTKFQALQIPELQIFPNSLLEDVFYLKMAEMGRISEEQGRKARERIKGMESGPCYKGSFLVADMMVKNLEKYGVPCAAWCED